MELTEAIKGRRSIRKYRPDPVPEEALKAVLEAVQWAPSWANTQCWEVIVVSDPEVKARLAEALPQGNPGSTGFKQAPLALVLCGKKGVSGVLGGKASDRDDWHMFDTGLAMQNLCLAAHGQGLGTVVIGWFDSARAAQILGVPEGVDLVAITPLGYPAREGSAPKRKDLSEFVFQNSYGKKA